MRVRFVSRSRLLLVPTETMACKATRLSISKQISLSMPWDSGGYHTLILYDPRTSSIQCQDTKRHAFPNIIFPYRLPVSCRSLPAAVVGGGAGHDVTASSTSSRNVVLLCIHVAPSTTRIPGTEALIVAISLASSYVVPPIMNTIISCGLSLVDPPPSTNGYCCSRNLPLMSSCKVTSSRGECCV